MGNTRPSCMVTNGQKRSKTVNTVKKTVVTIKNRNKKKNNKKKLSKTVNNGQKP